MKLRWFLVAVVGVLVAGLIALAVSVPLSSERMRKRVIATLADRLDAEVELAKLDVRFLPNMHADGSGLVVRHKGRRDVPPIISVKTFSVDGSLLGLWRKHVAHVDLVGLDIEIPPDHANPTKPSTNSAEGGGDGARAATRKAKGDQARRRSKGRSAPARWSSTICVHRRPPGDHPARASKARTRRCGIFTTCSCTTSARIRRCRRGDAH
jgi:hypothetical protein